MKRNLLIDIGASGTLIKSKIAIKYFLELFEEKYFKIQAIHEIFKWQLLNYTKYLKSTKINQS